MIKGMKTFQKDSKRETGITLVALVVTIVILIILATVTINTAFGENGLIKQAQKAKDMASNAVAKENDEMNKLEQELANIMGEEGEIAPPDTDYPTPSGGSVTAEGVPIPQNFYYVGGTKNDGVIISDNSADANKGTSHEVAQTLQGNQFVWVPVQDLSAMFTEETVTLSKSTLGEEETTTNVYSKLRIREGDNYTSGNPGNTSSVREPDILPDTTYGDAVTGDSSKGIEQIKSVFGYSGTDAQVLKQFAQANVDEYKEMYESIKKYKGFYIGRYELSGSTATPTSKAGTVLASQNWYNLKKACMNIIKGNSQVSSTMIYGVEWDETMNWLKNTKFKGQEDKVDTDSSNWGNYNTSSGGTGAIQPTGSQEKWSANHIYDLAGNCWDWTQETYSTGSRVYRGGNYTKYRS